MKEGTPLRNLVPNVQLIGSFPGNLPATGRPEIAFAGRSNVGKSSALNTLLRSKGAARVSSTPGRTQTINLFDIGGGCTFADLPGYGFARVPPDVQAGWKVMLENYLGQRDELRLVVVLVDVRRDPTDLDGMMLYALRESKIPALVVATKCDKLRKQALSLQRMAIRREFNLPAGQPVVFSSVDGTGRDEVWDHLEAACATPPIARAELPDIGDLARAGDEEDAA